MPITMTYTRATTLLLSLGSASAALKPKMVQEEYFDGKPLGPQETPIHVQSNTTTFLGECSPDEPFVFSLYGSSGRGAVGFSGDVTFGVSFKEPTESEHGNGGQIDLYPDQEEVNFFAVENLDLDAYKGIPFDYYLDTEPSWDEGTKMLLECDTATDIIVIVNDDIDLNVDAVVTEHNDGDEIEIVSDDVEAVTPLQGQGKKTKVVGNKGNGKGKGKNKNKRSLEEAGEPLDFEQRTSTRKAIKMHRADPDDEEESVALIDGVFQLSDGRKTRRTLVHSSIKKTRDAPKPVTVECCSINDDGDIEMSFPDLATGDKFFQVHARLGVGIYDGKVTEHSKLVDVSALFKEGDTVTVHGGWVRRALHERGLAEGDDVTVHIADLKISDPEDGQRTVGFLGVVVAPSTEDSQRHNRRRHLMRTPTEEEKNISQDMRVGRRPEKFKNGLRRGLQTEVHKKILVHGYCAGGNPYPLGDFTDAVAFDGGETANNWSHLEFAAKIDEFADAQGIDGCGIIAHSQGGAASLTLYNTAWSCLDYANQGGDRLIQTVGTPYGGTALAGNLAAIGDVFGAGCGYNEDLTYDGALTWQATLASWAKAEVWYYTTTFETKWWRYDYCHLATDLFLSNDEDGTTEKVSGTLSGANFAGHNDKECHTSGMRDPDQTKNPSRNADMNANAKF